ncbi:hypothetical protein HA402_012895 [Bradysia odoriphaga]|nr:hypothetical protein HA402_012895 [Bradysia odoriphaga]
MTVTDNRLEKYFVITPVVSIDRSNTRNRNTTTTTTTLMTTTTTDSNTRSWCSLWCSAIKCFNVNSGAGRTINTATPIGVYQQNDNHFIRIDLPRKYRDKNCNITYEL